MIEGKFLMNANMKKLFTVYLQWIHVLVITRHPSTTPCSGVANNGSRLDQRGSSEGGCELVSLRDEKPLSSSSLDSIGFLFMIASDKELIWKTAMTQSVDRFLLPQMLFIWIISLYYCDRKVFMEEEDEMTAGKFSSIALLVKTTSYHCVNQTYNNLFFMISSTTTAERRLFYRFTHRWSAGVRSSTGAENNCWAYWIDETGL